MSISNGITIIVDDKVFTSKKDFKLAIGNTDCVGHPEVATNYIDIPGAGFIDASESLTGRPMYKSRAIKINFGGLRNEWNDFISKLRNYIHGKNVKLIFDDDKSYYYQGRAYIESFTRNGGLGQFTLNMPQAEPYKYSIYSSSEEWIWDTFNFYTDIIRYIPTCHFSGKKSYTIPKGNMPVCPNFILEHTTTSGNYKLIIGNEEYQLIEGLNIFADIMVEGDEDVTLEFVFTTSATLTIDYRGGSL